MIRRISAMMLGIAIGSTANAAGQPVPHSFQAGTKAVASEVNENFQELADRIANLPSGTVLNAIDFERASGITGKTFQVTNGGTCTSETRTYTSNTVGGTTVIDETIVGTTPGPTPCSYQVWTYERDNAGMRLTQIKFYSPDGSVLSSTNTFGSGVPILPAQLRQSVPWTAEILLNIQPVGGSASTQIFLATYTLISLENVTVPANAYNNCLKITRRSVATSETNRVEWYCPGVGLVKRMDPSAGITELTGITP